MKPAGALPRLFSPIFEARMYAEDLSGFFADFGVECTIGGVTAKAIFDRPEVNLGFGSEGVRASAYVICAAVESFPGAKVGDAVISAHGTFKVRSLLAVDDGLIWSIDVL